MAFQIPFNKPFIAGKELTYIAQAVAGGQLSGDGSFTHRCHAWLEQNLACRMVRLTHSGTAALEMAAILADIQPGDEIIMPSFTFVSTANAFVLRGGVPVFVDIRPDTLNLDETLIETAMTPKTKAIVPVHYAGVPCEMNTILDVAKRHNTWVIEDAAQALLSTYHGRPLGTIADLGCISFHETKNIISGEGGALLVNRPSCMERAEIIREKGTNRKRFLRGDVDKYTWVDIGSSYLPSELTAAFLLAQFERANEIIRRRCRICDRYGTGLQELARRGLVMLPFRSRETGSNGHMYYLVTRSPEERQRLLGHLRAQGILAVFHYVPLHTSPAGQQYGRVGGDMTVTDRVSACLLRLPVYYGMTDAETDQVIEQILKFYAQRS
ncbi:MAG: dTDP-4-amino-4,6-dideoxygalactose transaminase [Verrucomicrobia bacterium]|nr:MAG: dTDP-4-amino-4,6-dideoxygalactose transaminase [Verrucomicrobiota bacterium]